MSSFTRISAHVGLFLILCGTAFAQDVADDANAGSGTADSTKPDAADSTGSSASTESTESADSADSAEDGESPNADETDESVRKESEVDPQDVQSKANSADTESNNSSDDTQSSLVKDRFDDTPTLRMFRDEVRFFEKEYAEIRGDINRLVAYRRARRLDGINQRYDRIIQEIQGLERERRDEGEE